MFIQFQIGTVLLGTSIAATFSSTSHYEATNLTQSGATRIVHKTSYLTVTSCASSMNKITASQIPSSAPAIPKSTMIRQTMSMVSIGSSNSNPVASKTISNYKTTSTPLISRPNSIANQHNTTSTLAVPYYNTHARSSSPTLHTNQSAIHTSSQVDYNNHSTKHSSQYILTPSSSMVIDKSPTTALNAASSNILSTKTPQRSPMAVPSTSTISAVQPEQSNTKTGGLVTATAKKIQQSMSLMTASAILAILF